MSTPATYQLHDWIEDVDSEVFLYVSGDNTPERASVKFRNMLNMYHADRGISPADAFIEAEQTSPFKFSFRSSHEEDQDTAYRYSIDFSFYNRSLVLTAETIERGGHLWREKPVIRPFFQGSVQNFIQRYSSSPSFTTGLYKIRDKNLESEVRFYTSHGNTPQEAAFKLGLMNGLHRFNHTVYPDAFGQANQEAKICYSPSSISVASDYLYVLTPSEDEEGEEGLMVKAYRGGKNSQRFFEGWVENYIKIFGKS